MATPPGSELNDPTVKEWCGRRYRDLFISFAAEDPAAVQAATRDLGIPGTGIRLPVGRDRREARQRVAERFLARDAGDWQLSMGEPRVPALRDTTLVFCPGLIGALFPVAAFGREFARFEQELGWRTVRADSHPVRGCEANIPDLRAAIDQAPGRVVLLGYSKGAPDILTLLAHHPEVADRVAAVVCWGGAVGGSYLADDIYARVEGIEIPRGSLGDVARRVLTALAPVLDLSSGMRRRDEFDVKGAIRDLTTGGREDFLRENGAALNGLGVPFLNVTAATRAREVPTFQLQGYLDIATIDPDNDMQLTQDQARMTGPMAIDLAVFHAHHWDIAYDPFPRTARLGSPNLDHRFPRAAALTALLVLASEVGLAA